MALPLLAPLAWLLPFIKIIALGSVKFVGVGLGAAEGHFTDEQLALIERANQIVADSIETKEEHLTRKEAREFLKEVLVSTLAGMKQSVIALPGSLVRSFKQFREFISK